MELRSDLEKLNSLAQLGIAVEILGHELQSYDDMIGSGLGRLPADMHRSAAVKDIELGYEGLADQLRFHLALAELPEIRHSAWITGAEIVDYVSKFFKPILLKNHISFTAGEAFLKTRIFDQQSRLYPVFINLLNNSIYWLSVKSHPSRKIVINVVGSEVVVSDNGPGVDPEDVDDLFSLFFTKKNSRGGRGVGLYLCRANLSAGGHRIRYVPSGKNMPLEGANFAISFRGAACLANKEHYYPFIEESFHQSRSVPVLIIDDDYPTFDEVLRDDNGQKKDWHSTPDRNRIYTSNQKIPRTLLHTASR